MILPSKYVKPSQSLIFISALILDIVDKKKYCLDYLWYDFKNRYNNKIKKEISYDKFAICLSFMYMQGMINYDLEGMIYNENIKS